MPNINVLKTINDYLIYRSQNNNHRDYSYFHASEWDGCHRKIAYAYYEAKDIIKISSDAVKTDPQLERIFDNGHYTHDRWKDYILNATGKALYGRWKCLNYAVHSNPKIYGNDKKLGCSKPDKCDCGSSLFEYVEIYFFDEDTWMGGSVDSVVDMSLWPKQYCSGENNVDLPDEEKMFLIDYKTINPFDYKDLTAPKIEHVTQLQIYFYLSGLKYGKVIYENKATQAVKEFNICRDDALIEVKKEEAIRLKYQLTNVNSTGKHVLPQRGYDSRGHKKCLDCKYRGHCWNAL